MSVLPNLHKPKENLYHTISDETDRDKLSNVGPLRLPERSVTLETSLTNCHVGRKGDRTLSGP